MRYTTNLLLIFAFLLQASEANSTDKVVVIPLPSSKSISLKNMVTVSKTGGNYRDPISAMNSLSNWCGTPSAENPCLVKIGPGVYDLGENGLLMQSWVDVEGSGEGVTIIRSGNSSNYRNSSSATISGADDSELRFLSVENIGGDFYAIAIINDNASTSIFKVTALASGSSNSFGILNTNGASPTISDSMASATSVEESYGVYNTRSSPKIRSITAKASGGKKSYGIYNSISSVSMSNVEVTAINSEDSSYGVYNYNSSPTIDNLTVSASADKNSYGIYNTDNSAPIMNAIHATSFSNSISYAIFSTSSEPIMRNITAVATGACDNSGIGNVWSTAHMSNVKATASGGVRSVGIYNIGSTSTIINSILSGDSDSVFNFDANVKIGNSMLNGPVSFYEGNTTGSYSCLGTYDVDLLPKICP